MAIDSIAAILEIIGKEPIVFLDFDGTLAPIVARPEDAFVPAALRDRLVELSRRMPVAVVSGRSLSDLQARVDIADLTYAGSHGQEVVFADGSRFEHPRAVAAGDHLDGLENQLERALTGIDGAFIERKPFSIAVHTRNVATDADREKTGLVTRNCATEYVDLIVRPGKEVLEIGPRDGWNKGDVIEHIAFVSNRSHPLFVGDDVTDEDGFRSVNQLAGVSVVVAPPGERLTSACFRLDDPNAVAEFLFLL